MKDNRFWVYLEPYVHLIRRKGSALLYNTVSKSVLVFRSSPAIFRLAGELLKPVHGYVVPLTGRQLENKDIRKFIRRIRQTYMGDIHDAAWSNGKPVNIIPAPFVKYGLDPGKTGIPESTPSLVADLDPRNYLQEMTLFLNSITARKSFPFQDAFLQFSFPAFTDRKPENMPVELARKLISEINACTPALIHISGANILEYPSLEEVIGLLAASPFQKKYHLDLRHWNGPMVHSLTGRKQTTLAVYVTFPVHPDQIAGYLHATPDPRFRKKLEFNFVVRTSEELQLSMEIMKILDLGNVYFKPYHTPGNLGFFRRHVFASRKEILAGKPEQTQVLARLSINENDFGKFSMSPSGKVFANLNDPVVGNARRHTLVQLVTRELEHGRSWRRIRGRVSPCKDCLYQFLCPPVSSYELFMKRFNFCTVFPNPGLS